MVFEIEVLEDPAVGGRRRRGRVYMEVVLPCVGSIRHIENVAAK